MGEPILELPAGEVHIWTLPLAGIDSGGLRERTWPLMDEGERVRHDRLLFDRNRVEFLATRWLARTTLSRCAAVAPGSWTFHAGPHGKPGIARPPGHGGLRFNLSNTSGLVALAVARDLELGIDVEDTTRPVEPLSLAERFFSPFEAAALRALPPERLRERFFRLWTLKESYLKARGAGLSLPLGLFSFGCEAPDSVTLTFHPGLDDDPSRWHFHEARPTPSHVLAVAVEGGSAGVGSPVVRFRFM